MKEHKNRNLTKKGETKESLNLHARFVGRKINHATIIVQLQGKLFTMTLDIGIKLTH